MAACALLGDNGDHLSANGSNNNSHSHSHSPLNSNSQDSIVEQQNNPARSKMVRKRMASEIEVQPINPNSMRCSSNNNNGAGGGVNYMRVSRHRSVMINPNLNPTHDSIIINNKVNMVSSNYSTTMLNLPVPSSSNNLTTLMTSGAPPGGALSTASASSSSPNWGPIDPLSLHHSIHQTQIAANSSPPAVCGFSGLPLFPPERTTPSTHTLSQTVMDQDSSATAWIDGIIKDLINSSTSVSIPQLIQNVREIIFPCNPNLASLLEYRLRAIAEQPPPPPPPPIPTFNRRRELQGPGLKLNLDDVTVFPSSTDTSSHSGF